MKTCKSWRDEASFSYYIDIQDLSNLHVLGKPLLIIKYIGLEIHA